MEKAEALKQYEIENRTAVCRTARTVVWEGGENPPYVAPTCTETGLTEGSHCSLCGQVLVAQEVIPATGHDYTEVWANDGIYHWHTTACGHDAEVKDKAMHTLDADNQCTTCGYQATPSTGLTFAATADGSGYVVTDIGTCTDTVLVVPGTYEGKPVTGIDVAAFYYIDTLTHVLLPNTITSIGGIAFQSCTALQAIHIPAGVTAIENLTFSDCADLTEIFIDQTDNQMTAIGEKAFYNCTGLTSITIPAGVTSIGYDAFRGCTGLTSITFEGTKAEWNTITKGSYWNNNTGTYTVYCTDGDIAKADS